MWAGRTTSGVLPYCSQVPSNAVLYGTSRCCQIAETITEEFDFKWLATGWMLMDRGITGSRKTRLKATSASIAEIQESASIPEVRAHQAGAISLRRRDECSLFVRRTYNGPSLGKITAKMYTKEQTRVLTTSTIHYASLRGQILQIHPRPYLSEAQGQMNSLFQSLYILFPPRLPRFGPEDVASTAEYYNRLARHFEPAKDPPGAWIGRISMQLAVGKQPLKTAEKLPQKILRRVARVLLRYPLGNEWRIALER